MKALMIGMLAFIQVSYAAGFTSGLNNELMIIYAIFIGLVMIIAGTPKLYKFISSKIHKHKEESHTDEQVLND
jgi:hypothetical protein